jgi:hypothetical protein
VPAPTAEELQAGKKAATLRGPTLTTDFKQMVVDYIEPPLRPGLAATPPNRS